MGTGVRSPRFVYQPLRAFLLVSIDPLIAGFPADTELKTQLIEGEVAF
jgi:hypothetical protein